MQEYAYICQNMQINYENTFQNMDLICINMQNMQKICRNMQQKYAQYVEFQ